MEDIKIVTKKKEEIKYADEEIKKEYFSFSSEIQKFDRQIRLFGLSTQLTLNSAEVLLNDTAKENNAASEILKNILCLGIKNISTNIQNFEYSDLFPETFTRKNFKRNKNIEVEIKYKIFIDDFEILTNKIFELKNEEISEVELRCVEKKEKFFLCTDCLKFSKDLCVSETNYANNDEFEKMNDETLLAAFFTQEIVKMLCGKSFISEFKLK